VEEEGKWRSGVAESALCGVERGAAPRPLMGVLWTCQQFLTELGSFEVVRTINARRRRERRLGMCIGGVI
jgi:hypothetical protein